MPQGLHSREPFSLLKINFDEPEDWNTWSKMHQTQNCALGCTDRLTANDDGDIKIGSSDVDPEQLRVAHRA